MRARLAEKGEDNVTLTPGTSGQFDVRIDGALVFSKHLTGRFPVDEDIAAWPTGRGRNDS